MEPETNNTSVNLSDFVKEWTLPQCVCVTEGSFLSRKVQISCGDVLILKSCDKEKVTLSYRKDNNLSWTDVNVSYLDYPQQFKVLLPRDASAGGRVLSMVIYPTIADLLLDCPTHFEATASYDDPYLPGMSVKMGDRFWFIGMVKNPKDGGVTRLKAKDSMGNIIVLSSDCRGNFYPLEDKTSYTIKQLIDQAPVQRRLIMADNETFNNSQNNSENNEDKRMLQTENTDVNETKSKLSLPLSSTNADTNNSSAGVLPLSFSGIIHMLKPESTVAVSPYNDLETTWIIPESANLKVRNYIHNDYEVPATISQLSQCRVHLPLSPGYELPKFPAPNVPPLPQPVVPVKISNFIDIYCSSLPVRAKILDTSESHIFFQNLLKNIEEVIIYKLDEVKRLYVKDTKKDIVYSLSHDVKLSFIEYPEMFTTISELLTLPIGSEVTVLEDIAADFPKPFSLRFGDIIRLTSNTPYLVKTAIPHKNCLVLRCERIDPEGGMNAKLKLPLDFEVNMIITTNPNSKRLILLQDILNGVVPIPSQNVASVPDDSESVDLNELPVYLQILTIMTEACVVVACSSIQQARISRSDELHDDKTASTRVSSHEPVLNFNMGLPLTSEIVLAFKDRADFTELNSEVSSLDYIRLPVEKMTMTQFEERKQQLKLNSDYEDLESCSSSTTEECGTESQRITKRSSNGILERKPKSTKMDKVRRLSRALNPKHWRHTKTEPQPLPHPSAMGLTSLGTRTRDDTNNEYQDDNIDSASVNSESTKSGSTAMDVSTASDEVEENFYEDVETYPIKSPPVSTNTSSQTGIFSGPAHRSLPPSRMKQNTFIGYSQTQAIDKLDHLSQSSVTEPGMIYLSNHKTIGSAGGSSELHNSVPKPFARAKNWATNFGNNIGNISNRLSTKPREDMPKSNNANFDHRHGRAEAPLIVNSTSIVTHKYIKPPNSKPPLPPQNTDNSVQTSDEKADGRIPPIPQTRQRCGRPSSLNKNTKEDQNGNEESDSSQEHIIFKSITLYDSVSSNKIDKEFPKPKPRGLKKLVPLENDQLILSSPQPKSRRGPARSDDLVRGVETLSLDSNSSSGSSEALQHDSIKRNGRPKPPPKPRLATHTTV